MYFKNNTCIDLKKVIIKIPKLKLVIMFEYQNTKTFFLKATPKIALREFLVIKKVKNTVHVNMLLINSIVKKLLEHFIKKATKSKLERILNRKIN